MEDNAGFGIPNKITKNNYILNALLLRVSVFTGFSVVPCISDKQIGVTVQVEHSRNAAKQPQTLSKTQRTKKSVTSFGYSKSYIC